MSTIEILKDIVKEYKYDVTSYSCGFLKSNKGSKIQLNENPTQELFSSLTESLKNTFGTPVYMHAYYGMIWENGGQYIAFNLIEEGCHFDLIDIFVLDKIPGGKKLTYQKYDLINETIMQTFDECGFARNASGGFSLTGFGYTDIGFMYIVSNEKIQWFLQLKNDRLSCYFSDLTAVDSNMTRVTPRYRCKKFVNANDPETIKNAMRQSFAEMNEI